MRVSGMDKPTCVPHNGQAKHGRHWNRGSVPVLQSNHLPLSVMLAQEESIFATVITDASSLSMTIQGCTDASFLSMISCHADAGSIHLRYGHYRCFVPQHDNTGVNGCFVPQHDNTGVHRCFVPQHDNTRVYGCFVPQHGQLVQQ